MKVFTCVDHDGHFPVGVASVVLAATEAQARDLLKGALVEHGLNPEKPFSLRELNQNVPRAFVLLDGEY